MFPAARAPACRGLGCRRPRCIHHTLARLPAQLSACLAAGRPALRRYELEKALVEGSIQVADLPRLWKEVRRPCCTRGARPLPPGALAAGCLGAGMPRGILCCLV